MHDRKEFPCYKNFQGKKCFRRMRKAFQQEGGPCAGVLFVVNF